MASLHLKTTPEARKRILTFHRKEGQSDMCGACGVRYPCIYVEMAEDLDVMGQVHHELMEQNDRLQGQANTIVEQANKIRGLQAEVAGKELGLQGYRPVVRENEVLREMVRLLRENVRHLQNSLTQRTGGVEIKDLGDALHEIDILRSGRKSAQRYTKVLEAINRSLRDQASDVPWLRKQILQLEEQLGERQRDDIEMGRARELEDEVEDKIFMNLRMQNERFRLSMQRIDPLWRIHHSPSRVENYVETLETRLDRSLMMLEHGVTIRDVPEGYDLDEEGFYAAEPAIDQAAD